VNRWTALFFDTVAIGLFALFARIAHQSESMPLTLSGWFNTMLPFVAGIFLAYLVAVIPASLFADLIWPSGVVVWLSAVVVGLLFWGLNNGAVPHWSFIIVATTASAILVLGWRALYRMITR
jgi:Protein of unknown function (DUF3054).